MITPLTRGKPVKIDVDPRSRSLFAHPFLALGFRPFFLLGGAFAALWIPLWLVIYSGESAPPTAFGGMGWHAHEMVFGFGAAIVAGFLLTAVKNWTRRATPSGAPLAGLVVVWLLGRVAVLFGGLLPAAVVAVVDVAFLPLVALSIARPIVGARNMRNIVFPLLLLVMAGINLMTHVGDPDTLARMHRLGVMLLVVMVVIMGGRVIPFFTRKGLDGIRVTSRRWLDWAALSTTVALVPLDLAGAQDAAAVMALLAGATNLGRLVGWGGQATLGKPILWVLHLGYLWLALGLLMIGAGNWIPALAGGALHALTVGALGTVILGMITRVSLGHTARPLRVERATAAGYGLITAAALARVVLPWLLPIEHYELTLRIAGTLWALAFGIFTVVYYPVLTRPRADGAEG